MAVITNTTYIIKSSKFPESYPANVDECWTRTPTCGFGVHLVFTDFDVSSFDHHICKFTGNNHYFRFSEMLTIYCLTLL